VGRLKQTVCSFAVVALVLSVSVAQGITIEVVPVGNAGNEADQATGYGAVAYNYYIGKYDVTIGQYCEFLNAVAKTDTYGLYNDNMRFGEWYQNIGITQSGTSGNYSYSVTYNAAAWSKYATDYPGLYPSASAAANACPAFSVRWSDAARFCNWLQNGQPTFPTGTPGEVPGSTETGAYALIGDTPSRNAGATWFLPSEDEWYKAAYHNPMAGTYWTYPTRSNTAPINILSSTGVNNANFYDHFGTGNLGCTDPPNYLTPVGAFLSSPGPYGTYDMGGDVWQFTEAVFDLGCHGIRGGAYGNFSYHLASTYRENGVYPWEQMPTVGFRVASSVPEPSSLAMLLAGAVSLARKRGHSAF
jgi:sulfatase modifying factor 1